MTTAQEALCQRISEALVHSPIHDHLGYEALAYLRLPGPHYYEVLYRLHRALKPKHYLEIGVRDGRSMELALPETKCTGIDPSPTWTPMRGNVSLAVMSSDAYFAAPQVKAGLDYDLAFIDGDHSFRQALRDFCNLEAHAKSTSVVLVHDVIPLDERTSTPIAKTSFWTGDVWRLMYFLVKYRTDLAVFTVAAPPTGLGFIAGFRGLPVDVEGYEAKIDDAATVEFSAAWDVLTERLNIVANTPAAFADALRRRREKAA